MKSKKMIGIALTLNLYEISCKYRANRRASGNLKWEREQKRERKWTIRWVGLLLLDRPCSASAFSHQLDVPVMGDQQYIFE